VGRGHFLKNGGPRVGAGEKTSPNRGGAKRTLGEEGGKTGRRWGVGKMILSFGAQELGRLRKARGAKASERKNESGRRVSGKGVY